jgi:probable rRNA maturation factor
LNIPKINLSNNTPYSIDRIEIAKLFALLGQLERRLQGKEIDIYFVDDEEMRKLNKRYLGRDSATDILTFPNSFSEAPGLGELVIDLETIKKKGLKEEQLELTKLFIHGLLHLLGYDHINTKERKKMTTQEKELLAKVKLREQQDG